MNCKFNYKFLSTLAFVLCMHTGVKADNLPKVMEKAQVAPATLKIGVVNIPYILDNSLEAQKNNTEFQSYKKQLENQLQKKIQELHEKGEAYQQQVDTLTEAQRKQKLIEFQKLQEDFRQLEEQQQHKMAEKYKAVMQPLYDRIQEVINKIAVEHKYHFVLSKNTDAGPVVLYGDASFDLSELVLEKLKAMAPKEVQPPVVGPKVQVSGKTSANKPAVKKK